MVDRYKYGLVICIFMACVYVYVIILTILGPEYKGRDMGVASDGDMDDAVGRRASIGDESSGKESGEKV